MKRAWKISDAAKAELFLHRCTVKSETLMVFLSNPSSSSIHSFIRDISVNTRGFCSDSWPKISSLFIDKGFWLDHASREYLNEKVSELEADLVDNSEDTEKIYEILETKAASLFRCFSNGSALIELSTRLKSQPQLAMEVFNWRRNHFDTSIPMVSEEYSRGITIAGRLKNVDLAAELFSEAANKGLKSTSTYNALIASYVYNGLTEKPQSLFRDLKREPNCYPTIVTYNILISMFGRMMLVDHMEATFREIKELNLSPDLNTYNNLIAGYVTAWMWDDMEKTFSIMELGPIKPDVKTHLLMLRGYSHSGKLEKMERTYKLVKDHVNEKEVPLIRAMICAYCKSSDINKVRKIVSLLRLIPEEEYRPWLNILLIRVYAQENLVEEMEHSIHEAFARQTFVKTVGIMRSIIASYFRCDAVDKLTEFVKQAETSGWKICRSLYHCKMVMFGSQNRLEEMEKVLDEMESFNLIPTKKTFLIMYKAYSRNGRRDKVEALFGTMYKHGFGIPLDALPS